MHSPQIPHPPFPLAREHFLYFELMVAPRAGWFQASQIYLEKKKKSWKQSLIFTFSASQRLAEACHC